MTTNTRLFRQHDTAPQNVKSRLLQQLTQEWAALHAQPSTTRIVRRWARDEHVLTGLTRPGDIVDAIDAGDYARTNELLLALIRLFQNGQQLAGRTVLQAMLPKLTRMASAARDDKVSPIGAGHDSHEDGRHIVIAEFWDVMAHYPVERRATRVAANLALDTLHRSTAQKDRGKLQEIPIAPDDLCSTTSAIAIETRAHQPLLGQNPTDPSDLREITEESDLLQVIHWGMARNVITRGEAQLLASTYLPDNLRAQIPAVAKELGITEDNVRQRCSRAKRKLTQAVRAEMEQPIDLTAAAPGARAA